MVSSEERDMIRQAEALYEERFKADLEQDHMHAYVVVEPDSGDYFLGRTMSEASAAAFAAHPGRRGFLMRVGHRAAVDLSEHLQLV